MNYCQIGNLKQLERFDRNTNIRNCDLLIGTFDGVLPKTTIKLDKMSKVNDRLLNILKSIIFNGLYFYL
jgi:hypothetical protein